jgi:chorismate synthase
MASNRFGTLFSITTWGESHGKAIGVVIDGCPAGLPITDEEVNASLRLRAGGKTPYVTSRNEKDEAAIYSGVFEGKTTGAPLSIIIFNHDADSSKYEPIKNLLRPGHANFTYLEKYGIFDYRGGGRSSARETACRVAAGAVAKKLLAHFGIQVTSYIKVIGGVEAPEVSYHSPSDLQKATEESPIFCPHSPTTAAMICVLEKTKEQKDSLGGIVETSVFDLPVGWGDPVYEKLEANLAKAMLSIPASKGFEIGSGFAGSRMQGSEHNDPFIIDAQGKVSTATNFAGGTLGGISTGLPLITRTAFKPTSSIQKPQKTVNLNKEETEFKLPEGSRHDPCLAIRAVPVVEAMTALVLADALLMNRSSKI